MRIGYIRVSTLEQNTARQDVLMASLQVDRTFTDKASGKNSDRPQLQAMMEFVREGDVVEVESISRFARNTKDFLDLMEQLNEKNVQFISHKERIDTSTPQGQFAMVMFAALAELERETTRQRQAEGIAIAKAEGRYQGRPKKRLDNWDEVCLEYAQDKIGASEASRRLNISRSTFYRRYQNHESNSERSIVQYA